jgi:hypothetical protein
MKEALCQMFVIHFLSVGTDSNPAATSQILFELFSPQDLTPTSDPARGRLEEDKERERATAQNNSIKATAMTHARRELN